MISLVIYEFMNLNQKLIIILSFGCVILSTFVDTHDNLTFNPSFSSVQPVVILNGGAQNRSSENIPSVPPALEQTINRHEMLRKHFPDWYGRINYKKKQKKFYRSALARIAEAKRTRVKLKLTRQEQDTFDYFNGKNFYKYHQSLNTPPNIFDTRSSFLLKIEKNKNMRENFLRSYNRIKNEN